MEDAILAFLKDNGFTGYRKEDENCHYIYRRDDGGLIIYGWEYTIWNGRWENPTKPAFYLYSGLGDHSSYAFKREADDIGEVMQVLDAINTI